MRIDYIAEPELEFGAGKHVDIRFGLMNYGPFDFDDDLAPKKIRLGIVGTPETVQELCVWLDHIKHGIAPKPSSQPNLFPRFPGYGPDTNLTADFVTDAQLQRPLTLNEITGLEKIDNINDRVTRAVAIFTEQITYLEEEFSPHVVLCALPDDLLDLLESEPGQAAYDFHDMLKARTMKLKQHTQIVLPATYQKKRKKGGADKGRGRRNLQDEATRAWNIYTALYYKSKGTPWRLVRHSSQLTTCYVGISFYRSLDGKTLQTSIAQVFNELGDGIIVRGGTANISKEDRQPHLSSDDAYELLYDALETYRIVHLNLPARVVIHKTSAYSDHERDGFLRAIEAQRVSIVDLLNLRQSNTRLFRHGNYPPLRGMLLSVEPRTHILYTRGSVEFFQTYPGMYVPRPLEFQRDRTEQTAEFLAEELMGLTKMNWNKTQFDSTYPITIEGARNVGGILKYVQDEVVSLKNVVSKIEPEEA